MSLGERTTGAALEVSLEPYRSIPIGEGDVCHHAPWPPAGGMRIVLVEARRQAECWRSRDHVIGELPAARLTNNAITSRRPRGCFYEARGPTGAMGLPTEATFARTGRGTGLAYRSSRLSAEAHLRAGVHGALRWATFAKTGSAKDGGPDRDRAPLARRHA